GEPEPGPRDQARTKSDEVRPVHLLPDDPFAAPVPRSTREPATDLDPEPIEAPTSTPSVAAPAPAIPAPSEPASCRPAPEYAKAVRTLLQAAGVPELEERVITDPDFPRTVGELLRETVGGLQHALSARALTKRELFLDMTLLAATE